MNDISFESLRKFVDAEGNHPYSGCTETQISRAESTLGVRFPPLYRAFMTQYNGGDFYEAAFTLFSVPDGCTAIKMSDNLGSNNMPGMYAELSVPQRYLKIGMFNFGDLICIDPDNGRVIQWDVEMDEVFLEYDSLVDFFRESAEEFLQP